MSRTRGLVIFAATLSFLLFYVNKVWLVGSPSPAVPDTGSSISLNLPLATFRRQTVAQFRHTTPRAGKLALVTSTTGRYFAHMLAKASQISRAHQVNGTFSSQDLRLGILNFFSSTSLERVKAFPLYVYHENSEDVKNERPIVDVQLIRVVENVYDFDLFNEVPWLRNFLKTSHSDPISRFYKVKNSVTRHTLRKQKQDIMQAKGLLRKVLAIRLALNRVEPGTVVLWIDMDTYFTASPDNKFMEYVLRNDVTFIPTWSENVAVSRCARHSLSSARSALSVEQQISCKPCADTGILAYVSNAKTMEMLDQQINMYRGEAMRFRLYCTSNKCTGTKCSTAVACTPSVGGLCNPLESLNDIAVFSHSMFKFRSNTTQGWFATGCLEESSGPWVQLRTSYFIKQKNRERRDLPGYASVCPFYISI
uniref:Uncharacterized protein n=1 Tax=Pyramimonas obovata TaxID=1411642 RepID=A0A7S0RWD6_9CHLO|mmetsp:Transcript_7123/g.14415  ORF Transcript_7123/g.14415 Transcript_7123/m.14415 type:complete len:422 (+) Transcript_7123:36-1301(+)